MSREIFLNVLNCIFCGIQRIFDIRANQRFLIFPSSGKKPLLKRIDKILFSRNLFPLHYFVKLCGCLKNFLNYFSLTKGKKGEKKTLKSKKKKFVNFL